MTHDYFNTSRSLRLTEVETSQYIRVSKPTLRKWRVDRKGPPYIRCGRSIRYDVRDLDAWLHKNRVETVECHQEACHG